MDDALDAGPQRLLHDGARTLHIGADDVLRGGGPEPIIGGGVNEVTRAAQRRGKGSAIADVAEDHLVGGSDVGTRA